MTCLLRMALGPGIYRIVPLNINTYTKSGLLDSTLKIWYYYRNGKIAGNLTTLVIRAYDASGKSTEERSFDYLNKVNKWDLTGKNIINYDAKGNLLFDVALDIKNSKNTISRLYKMMYIQNNQEIIRFEIRRRLEPDDLKEFNVDSALAHYNDEKRIQYDTTVVSSTYNSSGNRVTETYSSQGKQTKQILSSIYSQGAKEITYSSPPPFHHACACLLCELYVPCGKPL